MVAVGSMAPGAMLFPSPSNDAEKNAPLDVVARAGLWFDCKESIILDRCYNRVISYFSDSEGTFIMIIFHYIHFFTFTFTTETLASQRPGPRQPLIGIQDEM